MPSATVSSASFAENPYSSWQAPARCLMSCSLKQAPDHRIAQPWHGQHVVVHLDVVLQVTHACQLQRGRVGTSTGVHGAELDDATHQHILAGALLRVGHRFIAAHARGQPHDPWPQRQLAFLRHVDADVVAVRLALARCLLKHFQHGRPVTLLGNRLHAHAPVAVPRAVIKPRRSSLTRDQYLSQRLHHVAGGIALLRQDRALGQRQQRGRQQCSAQGGADGGGGHGWLLRMGFRW